MNRFVGSADRRPRIPEQTTVAAQMNRQRQHRPPSATAAHRSGSARGQVVVSKVVDDATGRLSRYRAPRRDAPGR
jgi:hypothetical protein